MTFEDYNKAVIAIEKEMAEAANYYAKQSGACGSVAALESQTYRRLQAELDKIRLAFFGPEVLDKC